MGNEYSKIRDIIYNKYKNEIFLEFNNTDDDFGSYIEEHLIVLPKRKWSKPDAWFIFAFLHEIGHIKTNTINMKRYEQEYLATQWAIDESKDIGFNYPKSVLYVYQEYIWKWRDTSIKHRGKNIKSN